MNILSIEKARNELLSFLENTGSRRLKAKRISEFFAILIEQKSFSLIESYVLEFIPKYLDCLKNFSPLGINPEFTQSIIHLNDKLIETNAAAEYKERLTELNLEIETKLHSLNKILAGEQFGFQDDRKAFFPLIEAEQDKNIDQSVGAIGSITIKVSKGKQKDKFIVVPSENESDKKLEEQINVSWIKAKEFCEKYVRKISPHHEVIISFDGNLGVYRGESLGAALTIAMIEEMLKHYNSQTVLQPISNVAFTGGISESGKVNKVSKEIVEKKVEIAFYSNCKTLAVPKEDEAFALYKLDELYKLYPKRNLRLVGVSDLDEILLRRDLVEIKKQKLVVRTAKFVKKNWVSAVVTVLLAILFGYLFVVDWDDNPAILENTGTTLFVKNKNGKLLWTRKLWIDLENLTQLMLNNIAQLNDINDDGINEVLLCRDDFNDGINEVGRISCYDYKSQLIWRYVFRDTIKTKDETHSSTYSIAMVQKEKNNNGKVVYCFVGNHPLFPSAIFRLSAKTGKRIDDGLWNAGHILNALIGDFNKDNKREIVALGVHNGFNSTVIFSVAPDSLSGQTPTILDYTFKGMRPVRINSLVKIEPSDPSKFYNKRMNAPSGNSLMYDPVSEEFRFIILEGIDTDFRALHYRFDKNLKFLSASPGNGYEETRDVLVREGKLSPPLTNTEEYGKMLRDKIFYWKNGKWVKREDLN